MMYNQDLKREGFVNPERNVDDEPEKDLAIAVCSLVFGVAGILTGFFGIGFDIAALVMGIVVLRRRYYGKGFAIAGIATSGVGIALTIALTIFICSIGGELKDDLISTITDYMYYYSDGGMFDDSDADYYMEDEDMDEDYFIDEDESEDEYTDEEEPVEDGSAEDLLTDSRFSLDGTGIDVPDDSFDIDDSDDTDTIDAEDAFGDESYSDIFSDDGGYYDDDSDDEDDSDSEE